MAAHKRIRITIETEQVLIIRRHRTLRAWCPDCGEVVEVVDLVQAEALRGMAKPRVRNDDEATKWHRLEGEDGTSLICLESVLRAM
jgi:hypothetical protein